MLPLKLGSRGVYLGLICINVSMATYYYAFINAMPGYATSQMGASASLAALIATAYLIGASCGRVLLIALRHDRTLAVKLIFVSTGAHLVLSGCYFFVPSAPGFIAVRVFQGICFSITHSAGITVLQVSVPQKKLATMNGLFASATIVGAAIGPITVSSFLSLELFRLMFLFGSGISFSAFLWAGYLIFHSRIQGSSADRVAATGRSPLSLYSEPSAPANTALTPHSFVVAVTLIMASLGLAFGTLIAFISYRPGQEPGHSVGVFFAVYVVSALCVRTGLGFANSKLRDSVLIRSSLILFGLGLMFVGLGDSLITLSVAALFIGLGFGASLPTIQTIVARRVSQFRVGQLSSALYLAFDLGAALGPVAGGVVVESWGNFVTIGISSIVVLLAIPAARGLSTPVVK
jgi:MFS family permease